MRFSPLRKGDLNLTSGFIYIGLACVIFFIILCRRLKYSAPAYTLPELAVFYFLMRIFPLLMIEEKALVNFIALGADAVVLAALLPASEKLLGKGSFRTAAAVFLFNPLPAISIISGSYPYIPMEILAVIGVMGLLTVIRKKYPDLSFAYFLNEYIIMCTGGYFVLFDRKCGEYSLKDILSETEFPILMILGAAAAVAAAVMLIRHLIMLRKGNIPSFSYKEALSDKEALSKFGEPYEPEKFGKKNVIQVIILTAVYAVAVFFQLGSFEAPSTAMCFTKKDDGISELVIDMGEYTDLSELQFFLGHKGKVKISLSAYNQNTREWISIDPDVELKSAYTWNNVKLPWRLQYLGVVFSQDNVYVNELVILDKNGNKITPANSTRYPELFDEQELYPEFSSYYYRMMFDEVYHGRTAYEFLHDLSIYENTHPPLGKIIISLGIAVFGMNPFGWRVMCAVCGTLMVPVMYLFAWKLSKRSDTAFFGAALFCTEFMHYTLSRIATIDIIVGLFILMMFCFMFCFTDELEKGGSVKKQYLWLFLCGVSTALAVATKWTGFYAVLGIALIFAVSVIDHCKRSGGFKRSLPYLVKTCIVCVGCFIIIPVTVYSLSYIQFAQVYTDKNFIEHTIANAQLMLSYHQGVKAPHPYSSEWYEWLIDKRPLLDALTSSPDNEKVSSVATFGNPLILYAGLVSFIHNLWLWRSKKNTKSRFLVIAYLAMLMPWLLIHRIVFIYQYFGCILIIVMMICNSIINMKDIKNNEIIMAGLSFALFALFFSELSGLTTQREFVNQVLECVKTWGFE